jgi:hypothetical protein
VGENAVELWVKDKHVAEKAEVNIVFTDRTKSSA